MPSPGRRGVLSMKLRSPLVARKPFMLCKGSR